MEYWVNKADGTRELAADVTLKTIQFKGSLVIDDMLISARVDTLNIGSIKQNACTFGSINALALKISLNNVFRLLIPKLNGYLSTKQLEVPHNIAGIFELSDLTLGYYDGYIYAGATPTFLPPNGAALFEVGDFEPELPKEIEIEWVMDTTNVEELVFVQ